MIARYLAPAVSALLAAGPATAAPAGPAEVAVLARPIARGELLSAGDFERQPRPASAILGAISAAAAAAHETTRALPAGAVVRAGDIVPPRLVRRGEAVTISVRAGGLVISTDGRALGAGGMGETVRVVSSATNRTLDGIVEGGSAVRLSAY